MKIPRDVHGDDAVKALRRLGFESKRQRGSHHILQNPAGITVVVPMHKPVKVGTLRFILEQANVTVEQFIEVL